MTSLTSRGWGRPSIFQESTNVTQIYLPFRCVSRGELDDTPLQCISFCDLPALLGFLTWAYGDNIILAPNRSFKIAAQRGHQHFPFGLRGDDGLNSLPY